MEAYAADSVGRALTLSKTSWLGETTGERCEVTLVYPTHADIGAGKISILVPVDCVLDSDLLELAERLAAPLSRHYGAVPTGSGGRPGLTSIRAINRKGTTRWSG